MEIFYDGIQNQIEATRRYRHDLANHIQTLEACLVLYSDTEEMREYMDNLKDRYHTLKNQEFLRDELVNSILLIKQEQCQEKGIPLSVDVDSEKSIRSHCCTIFWIMPSKHRIAFPQRKHPVSGFP